MNIHELLFASTEVHWIRIPAIGSRDQVLAWLGSLAKRELSWGPNCLDIYLHSWVK